VWRGMAGVPGRDRGVPGRDRGVPGHDGGVLDLYADVPGQPRAVAALEAAARRPVHAYLLVGPPGTGKLAAATRFAAALLIGARGAGAAPGDEDAADIARRVLAGIHPDVTTVEREGAFISIETAREVTRLAARSPVEGSRKVLILPDFHLVREAGPALLKTIEEPPPSTVFVVLAEYLPPELVTIASRCVRIDFAPLSASQVADILVAEGIEPVRAASLAEAAGGRLDRARLLATDPAFEARRRAWREVPAVLDGSGAVAAQAADRLIGLLDESVVPVQARQAEEVAALEERNARALEVNGKVGRAGRGGLKAGVRELEERHKREVRRQRTDELRTGLAALAGVYRDRLAEPGRERGAVEAVGLIDGLAADLAFNPGEGLALLALFVRLGRVG
jgi:DNA polymerase III subunit delta'